MSPTRILVVAAAAAATMLLTVAVEVVVGGEGKGFVLTLERASHEGMELSQLRDRDRVRHCRLLQQKPSGVVEFPVEGTYDPYLVGLYYAKVKLGNPPKDFYVQIDTGSDTLWVNCNGCTGCPTSTGLQMNLQFFDPSSSSTASLISCSDQRCYEVSQFSDSGCNNKNQCGFKFQYGDGSGSSGYYVSDTIHLSVDGKSSHSNASAQVVFGCSTSLTGDLGKSDRAIDGIIGFGQQGSSVISQLALQGVTPKAFTHCLNGDRGGGILVLGQIMDPNIVWTPLAPRALHYNVELQSIAVNGQKLNIDPSVFATSDNRGTIIDSGTTLAYLAEEAHKPVVIAIIEIVSKFAHPQVYRENQCFGTSSSTLDKFPTISLNFAGNATMILRPKDYLLQQMSSISGDGLWCIQIHKGPGGLSLLGDIVLKDKIVVYDIGGQRIGWANYDCSSSTINVSTAGTSKSETFNAGDKKSSANCEVYKILPSTIIAFLFHTAFFAIFPFL